jgi:hypothetical protein
VVSTAGPIAVWYHTIEKLAICPFARIENFAVHPAQVMPPRDARPMAYLPSRSPRTPKRSEDVHWVTYGPASSGRWSADDLPTYGTSVLPAPARPPQLQALLTNAAELGLTTTEYLEKKRTRPEIRHFSCWRLRWCAFCLVIASSLQASTVGAQLQVYYSGAEGTSASVLYLPCFLLALLVVALWSLLSQLLLWSDAAVMKVPEGVRVLDGSGEQKAGAGVDE